MKIQLITILSTCLFLSVNSCKEVELLPALPSETVEKQTINKETGNYTNFNDVTLEYKRLRSLGLGKTVALDSISGKEYLNQSALRTTENSMSTELQGDFELFKEELENINNLESNDSVLIATNISLSIDKFQNKINSNPAILIQEKLAFNPIFQDKVAFVRFVLTVGEEEIVLSNPNARTMGLFKGKLFKKISCITGAAVAGVYFGAVIAGIPTVGLGTPAGAVIGGVVGATVGVITCK